MACLVACFGARKEKNALEAMHEAVDDNALKASSVPLKGKGGKKTMEMIVLDGTLEHLIVTAPEQEVVVTPLDLSEFTDVELLLLINPHRGKEWAQEAKLQGPGQETWSAEAQRNQCMLEGLSEVEVLALVSAHHMKDYLAEQRRAQKVADEIKLVKLCDQWFDDIAVSAAGKQQARRAFFWRVVLRAPLVVMLLLFACCVAAVSDPMLASELVAAMESVFSALSEQQQ